MKKKFMLMLVLSLGLLFAMSSCQKPQEPEQPENPEQPEQPENPDQPEDPEKTNPDFDIYFDNLKAGSVDVEIEPKDQSLTYFFNLLTKEEYNSFASDEEIIKRDFNFFNQVAAQNGMTLEQLLSQELFSGNKKWGYKYLTPKTGYVFYIYGLSTSGEPTTAFNYVEVNTPEVEPQDCSFEIKTSNITTSSFDLKVIPSDPECDYYCDIMTREKWQEQTGGKVENLPEFIHTYFEELAKEHGISFAEVVSRMICKGVQEKPIIELEPNTEYIVFAIGVGPDATPTTEAEIAEVTTEKMPANTFTFEQEYLDFDNVSYYVDATQPDPYVAIYELAEYFEGMSDEEIANDLIRAYGTYIDEHIYQGSNHIVGEKLIPNKDYYLCVFGYNTLEITADLVKTSFHTPEAHEETCAFEFEVVNVKKTTAEAAILPSDDKTTFIFYHIETSVYEELGGNDEAIKTYANQMVDELWNPEEMSREEWLSRALETGPISWKIDDLEAGKEYRLFAIGMAADGTFTTKAYYSNVFSTESEASSIAKLEFEYVKNTNFDDPNYYDIFGWIYPTDAVTVYYDHRINDDSIFNLSDEEALEYLETQGTKSGSGTAFYVYDMITKGDTIYYVVSAYDEEGLPVLMRKTVSL